MRCGDADTSAMGDTGPCGPCGDPLGSPPGGAGTRSPMTRLLELWNLVFMQYERSADGSLSGRRQSIDTGMGLERIAAVLVGEESNYHTDLFLPILEGQQKPG